MKKIKYETNEYRSNNDTKTISPYYDQPLRKREMNNNKLWIKKLEIPKAKI